MESNEMNESVAWEWRQENPDDWSVDASEVWAVHVVGQRIAAVACEQDEDDGRTRWMAYLVLNLDEDGIGGLEAIDGYDTLNAAMASIERDRDQLIAIATGE